MTTTSTLPADAARSTDTRAAPLAGAQACVETMRRSLVKALSWRTLATAITALVAWLVTGELGVAASIGALDTLLKLGTYYLHERAWNRLDYGRRRPSIQPVQGTTTRED